MNGQETLMQELRSLLGMTPTAPIEYNASFQALGGDSLLALKLVSRCRKRGIKLFVNCLLQSESLREILERVSHCDLSLEATARGSCESDKSSAPGNQDGSYPITARYDGWSEYDSLIESGDDFKPSCELSRPPATLDEGICLTRTEDLSPLRGLQLSFAHESTKNPRSNIIQYVEVYKKDQLPRVKAAWRKVWEAELTLRTRYSESLTPYEAMVFDWKEETAQDQQEFEHLNLASQIPVMEGIGSCWRVVSLLPANKSVVIWTIHHALIDGYSGQLVLSKLRAAVSGRFISSGPQFTIIARELDHLREKNRADGDAFWESSRQLHAQAATTLQYAPPSDPRGIAIEKTSGFIKRLPENSEHLIDLGAGWNRRVLSGVAKQAGTTPAVVYHAAWALVMTVFADSDTVCFGTALSGRNLPILGVEETVGPLLNTLPLALCLEDDGMTLGDLAHNTQRRLNELSEYSWTTPENGFSRNFQCALAMQFQMSSDSFVLADEVEDADHDVEQVRPVEQPFTRLISDLPLNILVEEAYDRIRLQYNPRMFLPCQIEHLGSLYRHALQSFTRLDICVSLIQSSLITPECQRGLQDWGNCMSGTTSPLSVTEDLVTLFERAVDQNPDALAAQAGCSLSQHLTYRQMDDKASLVATVLCEEYGVKPGDVVCVDADRSLDWLVSIFAVLKTGAAYCPLDHELPHHLRSVMFARVGGSIFLASTRQALDQRGPRECAHALSIEELTTTCSNPGPASDTFKVASALESVRRRPAPIPESTAYVCFTSGSTGTPKGVICTHQGLVAFQRDLQVRLFAEPGIKVAQVMSPAFDGSIHEIFSSLCHGATLVLPVSGDKDVMETLSLAHSAILTPSLAEALDPSDYPSLRYVYLVGEPVKQHVNDEWGAAKVLYNMYGPTEGTCGATIKRLLPGRPVTIGCPNPSTRLYILGTAASALKCSRLMPPGTVGEICVAGVQVARGYLGMPDLTAERFVSDPHCRTGTADYLYRTGDRGYWSPGGEVVCLGRNDRQIKLRGFRLDLNDLEARLTQANPGIPGLKSVAFAHRDDHLIAAMQPADLALSSEVVTRVLTEVLPPYAQPRHVLFLDEWPMTKAGKLDYKELTSDSMIHKVTNDNRAAQSKLDDGGLGMALSPLESKIVSVWQEVLGLSPCEPIQRGSGFLQLGGCSLQQIRMLARLSSALQSRLPLKIIIESRTLGDLARRLEEFDPRLSDPAQLLPCLASQHPHLPSRISPAVPQSCTALSPIELDWWKRYHLHRDSNTSCFNVSFVASLSAEVDHKALAKTLDMVLSRYSLFRGRYVPAGGVNQGCGVVERRYVESPPKVQRLRDLNVWAEVNQPFNLESEPAIRMCMTKSTLSIVMSHIVADLTTLNLLLREAAVLYSGRNLPPVVRSYEQEAVPAMWDHEPSPRSLEFWEEYLCPSQAASTPRPKRLGLSGTSRFYQLSHGLGARMLQFCLGQMNGESFSLQKLAVAAVALATAALQEQPLEDQDNPKDEDETADYTDVVLGTPFINRSSDHDMETVGLFLNPLPVRLRYTASPHASCSAPAADGHAFLDSVRTSTNAALAHAVPWHRLLQHLENRRRQTLCPSPESLPKDPHSPDAPFDTMVTFHHAGESVHMDVPGVTPRITWSEGSKFPLMMEFSSVGSRGVILRAEYDTQLYASGHVDRFVSAVAAAIAMLIANEQSMTDMKREIRGVTSNLHHSLVSIKEDAFGALLEDLALPPPDFLP
ncbi:D-alanine-poly(Phosphoribitol) ligase subunit 1 [Diaporthe helianthi]|uniref:D-alanine-poly(Phosphoribitol) ligase subunit 1 n=1 Tax=Diaporthe helianthi TaxID=158607 RepID=A0A2P5IAY9_DIAHE|nr:D-alanine-poly(Phosphoribitol) ligase subunit 1 [Diaporthe helianthi]